VPGATLKTAAAADWRAAQLSHRIGQQAGVLFVVGAVAAGQLASGRVQQASLLAEAVGCDQLQFGGQCLVEGVDVGGPVVQQARAVTWVSPAQLPCGSPVGDVTPRRA
jgi:hypothetical protein